MTRHTFYGIIPAHQLARGDRIEVGGVVYPVRSIGVVDGLGMGRISVTLGGPLQFTEGLKMVATYLILKPDDTVCLRNNRNKAAGMRPANSCLNAS